MNENKQLICAALLKALQLTREGSDLQSLDYFQINDDEMVRITYVNQYARKVVNVTADSGVALIRDILKHI